LVVNKILELVRGDVHLYCEVAQSYSILIVLLLINSDRLLLVADNSIEQEGYCQDNYCDDTHVEVLVVLLLLILVALVLNEEQRLL